MSDDVLGDLSEVLQGIEGLGRQGSKEVTIGDFTFSLSPLGSDEEIEAYSTVEEEFLLPSAPMDTGGPTLRMGPAYVMRVKQEIILRAISSVNGVPISKDAVVEDRGGKKLEARGYLRRILTEWAPEVLNLFHIRYNEMVMEEAERLGYEMPHRTILSMMEQLLKAQVQGSEQTPESLGGGEDLSKDEAKELKTDSEEYESDQERPLPALEDPPSEGVLESDIKG